MAWPSSNKASTGNVDAGSDSPSSARADIKQNIDNVNSIIDTFNISSPSDGDLLQYSSSTGQWEQVASSSVGGGGGGISIINGAGFPGSFTIGDTTCQVSAVNTTNGYVDNISSATDTWTFTETGTYYFRFNGYGETAAANTYFKLKNNTQTTYDTWAQITNSSSPEFVIKYTWVSVTVSSTSDTYSMVVNSSTSSGISSYSDGWSLEFIKVA